MFNSKEIFFAQHGRIEPGGSIAVCGVLRAGKQMSLTAIHFLPASRSISNPSNLLKFSFENARQNQRAACLQTIQDALLLRDQQLASEIRANDIEFRTTAKRQA